VQTRFEQPRALRSALKVLFKGNFLFFAKPSLDPSMFKLNNSRFQESQPLLFKSVGRGYQNTSLISKNLYSSLFYKDSDSKKPFKFQGAKVTPLDSYFYSL